MRPRRRPTLNYGRRGRNRKRIVLWQLKTTMLVGALAENKTNGGAWLPGLFGSARNTVQTGAPNPKSERNRIYSECNQKPELIQ